jgi:transposase
VVLGVLEPYRGELAGVVVESTYNWYWLVDGLAAAGHEVKLANTVAMRRYEGLKYGDDESDARHLAQLLRLGILPEGYVHPPVERSLRDLARRRARLVQSRTRQLLEVENILSRQWGHRPRGSEIARWKAEDVDAQDLPPDVALAVKAGVKVIETLGEQIGLLEGRLRGALKDRAEVVLLRSIPGIGEVLSTVIVLETGEIGRFAGVGNFASYARCVGSAHYSNGRKKGEGNTKNGNAYLAWAFVEAAHFARRYSEQARRFFERKKARTNAIVATKALAHKLARAAYHVLKDGEPFDVKRCFA